MAFQQTDDHTQDHLQNIETERVMADGMSSENAQRTRANTFPNQQKQVDGQLLIPGTQSPQIVQHNGTSDTRRPSLQASNKRVSYIPQSPSIPSSAYRGSETGPAVTMRPNSMSKSPFSTPITCPPRSRLNQVLLVNPVSTTALTALLLNTLRPILPHGVEVTAYTAPYPAPTAIESTVDSVLSSEAALRDLAKYTTNNGETIQNYDGLLVASYSKHPLIDALRESYDVPVIGIMEASLYIARMLGGRFGIISTSSRMKFQIDDAVAAYGLSHYFVGVESLHINPLELLSSAFLSASSTSDKSSQSSAPSIASKARDELYRRLVTQARILVGKGADTVILGSEFLSSGEAIRVVKDAVRDDDGRRTVNVIDAVESGVLMLNSLISMGVPTSKKGTFRGEREGRRGRGQNWL